MCVKVNESITKALEKYKYSTDMMYVYICIYMLGIIYGSDLYTRLQPAYTLNVASLAFMFLSSRLHT